MSSGSIFRSRSNSTQLKYRRWEKVIQPLTRFDRKSSNLSYPIDLINELQKIVNKNVPLNLNLPLTLSGIHDHCLKTVYKKDQDAIGTIVFTPNIIKLSFDFQIQKENQQRIDSLSQKQTNFKLFRQQKIQNGTLYQSLPFIVLKQKIKPTDPLETTESKSFILSKDEYKKLINIDSNQIIQSFIYPNTSTASLTRFFYFPKKETLSIAYKVDNHQNALKKKFFKSLWRVEMENEHSFSFVKVMYHNKSFHQQTLNLVKAFQSSTQISVQKIVSDWVIDSTNRYVLIDVKEIKFKTVEIIDKPSNDLKSMLSVLTCSVCQQKFQNGELSKLLTYKLIGEFFQHLRKRRVVLSFKPIVNKSSSTTAKVCDLCYMLVVSESKLIELQRIMAFTTNSIQNEENEFTLMLEEIRERESGALDYKNHHLKQLYCWRLFLYIEDIKQLESLGEQLNKDNQQKQQNQQYFIMVKLHNSLTSFKLKSFQNKDNISVKGIKLTYLFSESEKIDKFLNKSQITIRLTYQQNWNAVIAEGNTSSLYHESEKFSMRKYKQILLFNSKSKYCVLGLHLGIKLDGLYLTEKLTLDKVYDAYMISSNFTNCIPLPPQWMEIIDPIYQFNQDHHKKYQYELNISPKQFKNMLPSIKPNNKKKLIL